MTLFDLDADEFYDVWREFNAGGRAEFEREWLEFQEWKRAREARLKVQ